MLILGIESSCDETSAAIIDESGRIISNIVSSQVELHAKYGGVVPELACRKHLENINIVIQEACDKGAVLLDQIDLIAVTAGPGLVGALLVGIAEAKGIAYALNKPLIGVNHLEGHILSVFLDNQRIIPFPYIAQIVSGGHTDIYLVKDFCSYSHLGATRDDALGEAFDKTAKMMGLPYPGGAVIEKLAKDGNPSAIDFPRAYMSPDSLDYSFSGVKTAVRNYIKSHPDYNKNDLAASFQQAVIDVISKKLLLAAKRHAVKTVVMAGGVASNMALRGAVTAAMSAEGIDTVYPPLSLCTDNAAMIAWAGYNRFVKFGFLKSDIFELDADPRMGV